MSTKVKKTSFQDIALMLQIDKSEKVIYKFVKAVEGPFKNRIYSYVKDKAVIDDLFMVCVCKIIDKIDSYNTTYQFSTWAYTIINNECIDYLRKGHTRLEKAFSAISNNNEYSDVIENLLIEEPIFKDHLEDKIIEEQFEIICKLISPDKTNLLVEKHVYELTYKEISVKYNIPIQQVRSTIHAAKMKIIELSKNIKELDDWVKDL